MSPYLDSLTDDFWLSEVKTEVLDFECKIELTDYKPFGPCFPGEPAGPTGPGFPIKITHIVRYLY